MNEEIRQVASDIQQLKDQVRVLTVAANDMVQPPHRSFLQAPPHPPFQQGGDDVGVQQLRGDEQPGGSGVGAFVPPRPANGASATEPGASALVPRPPHPPPPPPPPATEEMVEVVGLLKTVLTELTVF